MASHKLPVSSCQLPAAHPRAAFAGNWQRTTNNSAAPRRSGFTFTEVMFAVILLGIGFIMLAGMFPVAIQQTAQTQQETVGASNTLAAVKQLSQVANRHNMPPTGGAIAGGYLPPMVLAFREKFVDFPPNFYRRTIATNDSTNIPLYHPLWKMVRGDVIFSEDPRYGFVPFYQRSPGQNVAKLIVIATQNQNEGTYVHARHAMPFEFNEPIDERTPYAALEPRRFEAILSDGGPEADIIELKTPRSVRVRGADPIGCLGEGAFVVISDDRQADEWPDGNDAGRANGRIYRLGIRRTDLDGINLSGGQAWELVPGYDMASRLENLPLPAKPSPYPQIPTDENSEWYANTDHGDHLGNIPAMVYIIGRPQQDPTDEDSPYVGPVQDIAAYTTYINLK